MSFIGLAQGAVINLFMLLGFVAVFSMTRGWSVAQGRSVPLWVIGGLFGAMAVVAMLVPTATGPGIMFDCRSGVIGAGALLFGPMCALASLPLPCVYRLHVGGLGAVPGLLEIVLPAMLGTLVHLFFRRRHQNLTLRRAVLSSLIVGFAGNVIIASIILMLMPFRELFPAIGSLVIVVLSAPVAMAIFSTLLVLERTHFEAVEVVIDAPENVCPVDMDPDRIEQAIMHLAINAGEAMSGSGRMTVALTRPRMSTACSRRLQAAVHAGDFHRGDFALVSVRSRHHVSHLSADTGRSLATSRMMQHPAMGGRPQSHDIEEVRIGSP